MSWRLSPWWLHLTWPIAAIGIPAAAVGVLHDGVYQQLTPEWADQTFAQDLADLCVAFPLLILLALRARRGSGAALIVWVGVLAALFYTYVIYAFAVAFGPLYFANVAILGLTGWALVGAIASIDGSRVRERVEDRAPTRSTGTALMVLGAAFFALWLAEDLPAVLSGDVPESLRDVGLPTNPVHVLDMAFLLPAVVLAGLALRRGSPLGYWLGPALLATLAVITVGIVAIIGFAIADGERDSIPVAAVMTAAGVAQVALLVRFLKHLRPGTRAEDLLGDRSGTRS